MTTVPTPPACKATHYHLCDQSGSPQCLMPITNANLQPTIISLHTCSYLTMHMHISRMGIHHLYCPEFDHYFVQRLRVSMALYQYYQPSEKSSSKPPAPRGPLTFVVNRVCQQESEECTSKQGAYPKWA